MITENFIKQDSTCKNWDWGQYDSKLKGEYTNDNAGEVKVTKLSKKELEDYLKKFK